MGVCQWVLSATWPYIKQVSLIGAQLALLLAAEVFVWLTSCFAPKMANALYAKSPLKERIRSLLFPRVLAGEKPGKLFSIPIYQRRDGFTVRLGAVVTAKIYDKQSKVDQSTEERERTEKPPPLHFCIKDILVSYDLEQYFVCLIPVVCPTDRDDDIRELHLEELMVDIKLVMPIRADRMSTKLAEYGIERVMFQIVNYPIPIQRAIRRHQLSSSLRREIQHFLSGFSSTKTFSLGVVDWRLDPGILGLERETSFSMDFHMEKFKHHESHLDILLGRYWDVKTLASKASYREIITLNLKVDTRQEMMVEVHCFQFNKPLVRPNYREASMQEYEYKKLSDKKLSDDEAKEPGTEGGPTTSQETQETSIKCLADTAKSLTWDEFQNTDYGGPSLLLSPTQIVDGDEEEEAANNLLLDTSFDRPTSSILGETAALLTRANLNSDKYYYCSPVGKEEETSRVLARRKKRKSSTPTDDNFDPDENSLDYNSRLNFDEDEPAVVEDEADADKNEDCGLVRIPVQSEAVETSPMLNQSDYGQVLKVVRTEIRNNSSSLTSTKKTSSSTNTTSSSTNNTSSSTDITSSSNTTSSSTNTCTVSGCSEQQRNEDPDASLTTVTTLDANLTLSPNNHEAGYQGDLEITSPEYPRFKPRPDSLPEAQVSLAKVEHYLNSLPSPLTLLPVPATISPEKFVGLMASDAAIPNPTSPFPSAVTSTPPATAATTANPNTTTTSSSSDSLSPRPVLPRSNQQKSSTAHTPLLFSPRRGGKINDKSASSEDEANGSVASSRSRTSRLSEMSSLNGRFSQGGAFYGAPGSLTGGGGGGGGNACPFPDDWQYNTIPEVIENDDEID